MPDLPDELIRINAILHEYVAIHDAIFKFAWRKAIPIPGLFKPTDFGAHFKGLTRLASKLSAISSALNEDTGALEGSHQYAAALLEAVQALREICRRFYEKSQGHLSKYPMAEYNADLKVYEGLLNKCQEFGIALNRKMHEDSVPPEG
ncbi:MAG: hypothetical protein HXY51_02315 [Nitrospirae bacterium]|nr:hypothetical protein [Nitrospirota bacterium]